jgi:SNF2 family DNA or RNA helicase
MSRQCDLCGHPPMKHFSYFNKSVINPIQRNGYVGEGKTAMVTLKNEVLDKIMLRRTKADVAADINLPALSIVVQKVSLKPSELDFYESIYKQTQVKFDDFCLKGTLLHNYAHIFDLLARLRQTCDHPYLVSLGNVKGARASIPTKHTNASAAGDLCGLCQDVVEASTAAVAGCKHVCHSSCITEYTEQVATTKIGCPVCFKPLSVTLAEQKEEKQMLKEQKEDDISKLGPSPRDKPSKRKSKAAAAAAVEEDEEEEDAAAELERALAMSLETTAPAAAAVKPAPAAVAASHKVNGVKLGRNNFMQRMDIGAFTSSSKLDALVLVCVLLLDPLIPAPVVDR